MASHTYYFKDVTLLITHYNRSNSLERLLGTFKEKNCHFEEVIVSDDASKDEHFSALIALQELYQFKLITTPVNKGLGNNINKGQQAVKTGFTLYVQEDFVPTDFFVEHFKDALDIMTEDKKWDYIRFYSYSPYPYLKEYKKGFFEMIYKPWYLNTRKIYCYTDHPHIRRSNFLDKFGKYEEDKKLDKTEYYMSISFIQKKGKALFYNGGKKLFEHLNSADEPSSWQRKNWRQKKNFLISSLRYVYRQVRYNYDILFWRKKLADADPFK